MIFAYMGRISLLAHVMMNLSRSGDSCLSYAHHRVRVVIYGARLRILLQTMGSEPAPIGVRVILVLQRYGGI